MFHIPGVGQVVLGHRRRPRNRYAGSTSFRHDGLLRPQKGGWAKVWAWLGLFWAEIKGFHKKKTWVGSVGLGLSGI